MIVIVIVIVKTICNAHKVNAKHRIGGAMGAPGAGIEHFLG